MQFLLIFCIYSCFECKSKKKFQVEIIERAITEKIKDDTLQFPIKKNTVFVLTSDFNLKGKVYTIPASVTIRQKQGVIKNGTLIGNGTKIDAKKALFENVKIKGDWSVPKISTDLFVDLSYDNALRDVVALSSDNVLNTITIKKGIYSFLFINNGESGIMPASNTKLQIEGCLQLKANDFKHYKIVNIKGDNIHVFGDGVIEGDKFSHTGKDGEWGMGVNFTNATNCSLSGLTIKNCWGDCVYIGRNSKDCSVSNCILDNGRRQGISITSGENIEISDCKIVNVCGTAPEFGIDIEPNKGDTVRNLMIKNVIVRNCIGGMKIYTGKNNGSYVENVVFSNCSIDSVGKKGMVRLTRCHDIKVINNELLDNHLKYAVVMSDADDVVFTDNKFNASKYVMNSISGVTFQNNTIRGGELYPVDVKNMMNSAFNDKIKGNKIIKNDESK